MKKYFGINKIITIFCFFCFAIFILCIVQTYQKQNEDDGEIDIRTGTAHDTERSTDESLLMKEKIIYQNKRVNSVGLIQLESIGVESIEIISIDFCLPYPKTNSASLKKHNIKNYDNLVSQEFLTQKIKIIAQLTTPLSIGFRGYRINSDIASEIANISNVHTLFFDKCEIISFPQKINFNSDHSVFILSRSEIKANLIDIFN
jgi:hypothetical protein